MSKKSDKDWVPTSAVRYWAKKYAEKQYQRKEVKKVDYRR